MRHHAKLLLVLPALLFSAIGLLYNTRYLETHQGRELDAYLEAGIPPELDAYLEAGIPPELDAYLEAGITPESDAYLAAEIPPPPPRPKLAPAPATQDFWEKKESSCFHVDSVCSKNDRWFYGPTSGWLKDAHQPTVALKVNSKEIQNSHGYDVQNETGIYFNVSSTSHQLYDDTCVFSPTPHHMVVQSAWSEMMGEFYSRTILGLNQWMRDFPPRSNDDIQMYIHHVDTRKQNLLEGHHLFLGGLPNNNKFNNFLSMMPDDSCRCYTKLIFCGYHVKAGNATLALAFTEKRKATDINGNVKVLIPAASISNPKTACAGKTDAKSLRQNNCPVYRTLRRDLMSMYSEKDPMLDRKIQQYRRQILIQKGFLTNNTTNINEWKFVGLAHRKFRRKWLNIDAAISTCDRKFRSRKIVCITVDVEEADSPEKQMLMHRSIHAFIGVHGAQLTQGVILPRHGYILELLPWVPFYLWGNWVTSTHRPTPLGVIFHKTDLNHVGYPLGRDSVPLCLGVNASDEVLTRHCLMNNTTGVLKKFRWADRDFHVDLKVIEDFISIFLLKDNTVCDDLRRRAERKNFVIYNAFCKKEMNKNRYDVEHYYRNFDESKPMNIHEKK